MSDAIESTFHLLKLMVRSDRRPCMRFVRIRRRSRSLVGGITALRRESALWVMSAPWRRDALAPFAAMGLQIHEGVLGMVKALHAEIPKDLYLFGLDSN